MKERIQLGGRWFVPIVESTLEHDLHFTALKRRAGLETVLVLAGDDPESFARKLSARLFGSGRDVVLEMAGALIVPEDLAGEPWTLERGRETAAFLGQLTDPDDKQRFQAVMLGVVADFFADGLSYLESTRSSSAAGPALIESPAPPVAAAPAGTANGAHSSAGSPAATPSGPGR